MIHIFLLLTGLLAYQPTYKIIKDTEIIIYGTVLNIQGPEFEQWAEVRVDTIYRGRIPDSIIDLPFHYDEVSKWEREKGTTSGIWVEHRTAVTYYPGISSILFIKEVNREEVDWRIGKPTKYDLSCILCKEFLFSHSEPKSNKEEIKMIKQYCDIIKHRSLEKRAELLYEWYQSTDNKGLKYELLEAIGMEECKFSCEVMKDILKNHPTERFRTLAARSLGSFKDKDDTLDSLLLFALHDLTKGVRSQVLTSLAWRKKEWTIPHIRELLYDTLCCGEAVGVLFNYFKYFTPDSLLMVISKIPCENAKEEGLKILQSGIRRHTFLREKELSPRVRDSIHTMLSVIEWTPKLKDSLLSFTENQDEKIAMEAMLALAGSHDRMLFSLFAGRFYSLKNELLNTNNRERMEIKRKLVSIIYILGVLKDKRAIPLLMDLVREYVIDGKDLYPTPVMAIFALSEFDIKSKLSELEVLKLLTDDKKLKKHIERIIERKNVEYKE